MRNQLTNPLFIVLIMALAIQSCKIDSNCIDGNGSIVTEVLELDDFDSFTASGPQNIEVIQGDEQRVTATGHQNIIDRLNRTVTSGVWNATLENGCYDEYTLDVMITIPYLESAETAGASNLQFHNFDSLTSLLLGLSGAGDITQDGAFEATELVDVRITGAGNTMIEVSTPLLQYAHTGAGNAEITGEVVKQNVAIDGAGNYTSHQLVSDTCNIVITGSGNATVRVNEFLKVRITGTGNVMYYGNPNIDSEITGTGSLIDAN